jgi:hypothetical protein
MTDIKCNWKGVMLFIVMTASTLAGGVGIPCIISSFGELAALLAVVILIVSLLFILIILTPNFKNELKEDNNNG